MTPLRGGDGATSPQLSLLSQLLGKVEPLPRSAVQRRRVWAALKRPARASTWRGARFVLAAALAATAASASIGYWRLPAAEPPAAPALAPALSVVSAAPAVIPPREEPINEPLVTEPSVKLAPAEVSKPRRAQHPQPSRADLEATLMLEALRTRNSGDAARAGKLAEEYQRKHPNGPLQEEALALALEAAAARGDASAVRLARQYLQRYPNGRFQNQAARVLRGTR